MRLHGVLQRALALLSLLTLCAAVGPSACCTQLASLAPNAVFFPGPNPALMPGPDVNTGAALSFDGLNTHRWSNTAILVPACIFRPSSASDLGLAIHNLAPANCSWAVKSGGHTPNPGANNIANGVSIDLSALSRITYVPSSGGNDVVRLGAGATWQMAYDALVVRHEIGFPGGLCGTTGVGGVALGGGQSVFQAKVGWVTDNIVEFEMVLATGEVALVNAKTRPDLFKALKGGGLAANFGIVTRVDVRAFSLPGGKMWGGALVMQATDELMGQTLQAITQYTTLNNKDMDAASQVLVSYGSNGQNVVEIAMVNGAGQANSSALQPFLAMSKYNIAALGQWGPTTLPALIKSFDPSQPWGRRDLGATVTFVNDAATIAAVQNVTDAIYKTIAHIPGLNYVYIYTPQPKVTNAYTTAAGGNMLGLADTTVDRVVILLVPSWQDAQYDDAINNALQSWTAQVQQVTTAMGKADPFQYANFAASFQKPLCSYGQANVDFMRSVAAKYDPAGVFQTLAPGGFKVTHAC